MYLLFCCGWLVRNPKERNFIFSKSVKQKESWTEDDEEGERKRERIFFDADVTGCVYTHKM